MLSNTTARIDLESLFADSGIGDLLDQVSKADIVVIDTRPLKRVNVTLLEAFVKIKKAMLRNGRLGTVRLIVGSPMIRRTLAVTGLGKLFEVRTAVETAGAAEAAA